MNKPEWPLQKKMEVEWVDSCSDTRWNSLGYYQNEARTSLCRSTGYLLSKTEDTIILIQSISGTTDNVAESISIPMVAVTKMRVLKGGLE